MNADEAKKKALSVKKAQEENSDLRKEKRFQSDVSTLIGHFHSRIADAVNRGHLSTSAIEFEIDRFSDDVIREVTSLLRDDGYNLAMEKHNAFQKLKFIISWS